MKLFVHRGLEEGVVTIDDLDPDQSLETVLGSGVNVWVIDADEPLALSEIVGDLVASGRDELAVSTCKKVVVGVSYNGLTATIKVSPARKVRAIIKKAIEVPGLAIDPASAADLELHLPGNDDALDVSMPIGRLLAHGSCDLKVVLSPAVRHAG